MNALNCPAARNLRTCRYLCLCLCLCLCLAWSRGGAAESAVHLSPAEITHLGLHTAPVTRAAYLERGEGFAVVVGRELVAEAMAELITARAAARQSHAALERMRRLAGTAGADSASAREAAERQATVDAAALNLAQIKTFAAWGQPFPASVGQSEERLNAIAAGRFSLVRLTFPLGTFADGPPHHLALQRLDSIPAGDVTLLWSAPSDESMPGSSYFATLDKATLRAGEHLAAWTSSDTSQNGGFIPAAALIANAGRYWCYIEHEPGSFTRTPIDIHRPLPGGYFMADSVEPGAAVVVSGTGLLLAHESSRGAAP